MNYSDPLAQAIAALDHVESVNIWEKNDKVRLYVNVASQNRFGNASTIYIDMTTGELVAKLEKGRSGAKSYAWSQDVATAIQALLDTQGLTEEDTPTTTDARPRLESFTLNWWADSHETSIEVAEAIAFVTDGTLNALDRVWQDPTHAEILAIWERATQNGLLDDTELFWGEQTLHSALNA